MAAEVRFENITKRFGSFAAVKDLNLTINPGEFVTLVGPSGCGKSTTLNLLAGLEDPSEGLIYIDNKVINDVPSGKRDIAMVFQSYALYPHMTVRENIGFGLKVRGMPAAEITARVQEAAQLLGINELLDRKPKQLSGGQRQRVALGRAITREPKVFLLDEPLSNLDAKLRTQMRADLKLLFNRLGGTVVYVTHDQAEAMTLSDRVVVMRDGFVQQVGDPLTLYNNPDNVFVAGFLGNPTMNFVNCEVEHSADQLLLHSGQVAWPVQLPANLALPANRRVIMGLRPEDITVGPAGALAGPKVDCTIEVVEHMGSVNIVYVNVHGSRLVASMETAFNARSGDAAALRLNASNVCLFNSETAQRIRPA